MSLKSSVFSLAACKMNPHLCRFTFLASGPANFQFFRNFRGILDFLLRVLSILWTRLIAGIGEIAVGRVVENVSKQQSKLRRLF